MKTEIDWWALRAHWKKQASELSPEDQNRHARVGRELCKCRDCFCCACEEVRQEKAKLPHE